MNWMTEREALKTKLKTKRKSLEEMLLRKLPPGVKIGRDFNKEMTNVEIAGTTVWFRFKEESRSTGGFHRTGTGKLRGIAGTYGDVRQFPERKDHDAWTTAIAEHLIAEAIRRKSVVERDKIRRRALMAFKPALKELKELAPDHWRIEPVVDVDQGEVTDVRITVGTAVVAAGLAKTAIKMLREGTGE